LPGQLAQADAGGRGLGRPGLASRLRFLSRDHGRDRDRRTGLDGNGLEGLSRLEAHELVVCVADGLVHSSVRVREAVTIGPQLLDVRAQQVAPVIEVADHALAQLPGLGDHLAPALPGCLDDRPRIFCALLELLGAEALGVLGRLLFDPAGACACAVQDIVSGLLCRVQRARDFFTDQVDELLLRRNARVAEPLFELGEALVQRVVFISDPAKEVAYLPLVEALAVPREGLLLDLVGRQRMFG
jgi:hypothetical protein